MRFEEKRIKLLKKWYEFEKTKTCRILKFVIAIYGLACLGISIAFTTYGLWWWVFYSQWIATLLPAWARGLSGLSMYLGKLTGLTRFRKGTLLELRKEKFQTVSTVLYSTEYSSIEEARNKWYPVHLLQTSEWNKSENWDRKAVIHLGIIEKAEPNTVFIVVEDERVDKNPFKVQFDPYNKDKRGVKVFSTLGTYWADPLDFTKLKKTK